MRKQNKKTIEKQNSQLHVVGSVVTYVDPVPAEKSQANQIVVIRLNVEDTAGQS